MEGDVRPIARTSGPRRVRSRGRAQATVEFAFAAPLFLVCLLGAIDAGLWAVQTSAEVAAVEQAARVAASAGTTPTALTAPDSRQVTASVIGELRSALFGTRVVAWCAPAPGGGCVPASAQTCPTHPADVEAVFGPRVVAVCVSEHDPPVCTTPPAGQATPFPQYCTDSPTITVRAIGFLAALVPPGFGPGALAGEVPTDISATTHTLRFVP